MKRAASGIAVGIAALLAAPTAGAQDYPARPVRMVVPYAAGGSVDIVTRITAQKLTGP